MPLQISESTIGETGSMAGHFIENKYEDTNYGLMSIIAGLNMNIFGSNSIGIEICGFIKKD